MTTNTARTPDPSNTTASEQVTATGASPAGERPDGATAVRRKRRATDPGSAQALAMLTRMPIFATPVSRVHVGPREADGSVLVDDRVSDRRFRVYTPRRESEFRAGHRAGLWYVRTAGDAESSPRSPGFLTAAAAIDDLRSPRRQAPRPANHPPVCRVYWS
jgi:hypothetical protein